MLQRNKVNGSFVEKKNICIIIISNINLVVNFWKRHPKRRARGKKDDYLVWTDNEVQLVHETTRDF